MSREKMVVGIGMAIAIMVGLLATRSANCLWGLLLIVGLFSIGDD